MTTTKRIAKTPAKNGPWAWRDYLPANVDEWLQLRERAIEARPDGVDVLRFADWVFAEIRGEEPVVTSPKVLAKYRRTLYELAESAPPKPAKSRRRRDAGLTDARSAARLAAGVAAGGIVAYATGNPVLALLAPVIPADASYVELDTSTAWDEQLAA